MTSYFHPKRLVIKEGFHCTVKPVFADTLLGKQSFLRIIFNEIVSVRKVQVLLYLQDFKWILNDVLVMVPVRYASNNVLNKEVLTSLRIDTPGCFTAEYTQ